MKIDEQFYIPLHWFLACITSVVIAVGVGAFWVKSVDDRLSRIEQKLSIPALVGSPNVMEAHAEER